MSILDNDLYKFSTSYAYMNLFPEAEGTFTFRDRHNTWCSEEMFNNINYQLELMDGLSLTDEEIEWLMKDETIPYIPKYYWEWLSSFRFDSSKIRMSVFDGELHIDVTDKMYKVTLYEVPILAIVGQARNEEYHWDRASIKDIVKCLAEKVQYATENELYFSEFGTRRRYSAEAHDAIVEYLSKNAPTCTGTSNVHLARKYNIKPQGTFPHEWVMFHGATGGYKQANQRSLEDWQRVYRGNLGTGLIDTYTTDVFLRELTMETAKVLDGLRQDSGDEIEVGEKIIKRYQQHGINPKTKTVIFSNALDFPKYKEIRDYFNDRIIVRAGIGGNLSNDPVGIDNYKRPNMVMKLSRCRMTPRENWQYTVKLSDDLGKAMGREEDIAAAKFELGIK